MVQKTALLLIMLALLVNPCVAKLGVNESAISSSGPTTQTTPFRIPSFGQSSTKAVPNPSPISLSYVNHVGYFLLPVSLMFIIVNGFLVGLICKNWEHISDHVYYNATLLCLLLTSSDLALSLFLGLPIGIRFTFEKQLRDIKSLEFYTEKIGFLLFEYLYILRVITVAVISAERCFHILLPFRYMMVATERRAKIACAVIVILPLLRIAPVIYVLHKYEGAKVHCMYYHDGGNDGTPGLDMYSTPLTCMIDMESSKLPNFDIADIVIMSALIGISWFIILISNLVIVVVIFDKIFTGYFAREHKVEMNKKLMKISFVVLLISSTFALTHFPFAYAWCAHVLREEKNYMEHFLCILSLFFSLFFHPWFYCLRMKNIRELITGFKKSIKNLKSSASVRSSATSTMMFSLSNSRASAALIWNRASQRV